MSRDLHEQVSRLQAEVDRMNEEKSDRIGAEVALLSVGMVVGFVLGLWAAGMA